MRTLKLFLIVLTLFAFGCASQTGWQPTVDYRGERSAETVHRDYAECGYLARQASGTGGEVAKGAVVGGLLGAATGAAVGAAVGNPGAGAAIGAATGGIGGPTPTACGAAGTP